MYTSNFKPLAQFGGGLYEEQTWKMRKNHQKTTFFGTTCGLNGAENSRPPKAYLGPVLNAHS